MTIVSGISPKHNASPKHGSASQRSKTTPTIGAANRPHHRRSRNEFRAWLIWELNKRGANLPPNPTYLQLQAATLLNLVEV